MYSISEETKYFNDTLNVSERKFKREMCYDGALVMPKNFAVVNEEEMEYVEGGGWLYDLAIGFLGSLVYDIVKWGAGKSAVKAVAKSAVKAAVKGVAAAYGWVSSLVSSAAAWAVANPTICISILVGCTAFVAGIVIGMNI